MRRALVVTLALLIASLGVAGWVASQVWKTLNEPLPLAGEPRCFLIPAGASMNSVAARLADEGLIRQPDWLTWYARLRGDAARIQAGEYQIQPGTSPLELLAQFIEGRVFLHGLTLVEGWTFRQVRAALAEHPALLQASAEMGDSELMESIGLPGEHPEGHFFPDTYRFPRGTRDIDLLARAQRVMARTLAETWEERQPGLPLETPYQALILASIVERETALDSERAQIAGVFVRRLRRGMRLQTDPTVIYGLGENFDGDLRSRDLSADTPYNTYTRAGLPPTPIAMPGAASLRAAVTPASGDSLYFVATGLPDGSHKFSATLAEHNAAVKNYLRRLAGAGR